MAGVLTLDPAFASGRQVEEGRTRGFGLVGEEASGEQGL